MWKFPLGLLQSSMGFHVKYSMEFSCHVTALARPYALDIDLDI